MASEIIITADPLETAKHLLAWAVAGIKSGWQYDGDREDLIEDAESFLENGPPKIHTGKYRPEQPVKRKAVTGRREHGKKSGDRAKTGGSGISPRGRR